MRKLAKETGISFVSIFHSLKAHKKKLKELFQEDYNNLKQYGRSKANLYFNELL